ncbi:recombinase family protein [Pumilibacter intestinalis]|uniref:recombinase family protein n=1 Tax=Pumilibacter intestinalis TaxID=2941511 RepID=UPI00204167F8|nr:recombinase family protein [Pumilibacter intestinalis]
MNNVKEVRIIKATRQDDLSDKLRVAAYCRVSSDENDHLDSFYAQVRYYTDYIRVNENMRLVDIYADEGITGTSMAKRDDFKRLVADIKKKKIDRVLVKSVTRFARNSLECIENVRLFKAHGASIFFENDNIDTERMNSEMILYIKSAFAQGEAISASRRMCVSNRMRMADGTYNLSKAPFGYRLDKDGLVVEPREAEIVKKIFELYLSGMGDCLISQTVNEQYKEQRFTIKAISYILSNERYIGDCLLQKSYSTNTLPLTKKVNNGELPKYYYTGTHEPILDKAVFYKVQAMRKERKDKFYVNTGVSDTNVFLQKKVYCRHCGWAYKKKIRNGELYWCCHKQGMTTDACRAPAYADRTLRQAFVKMFNTLKQNSRAVIHETLLQMQTLKMRANGGKNEIAEIDKEILSLSEQNRIYSELFAQHILDEVSFYEQTDKLQNRITELRSRRLKILNDDEDENSIEQLRALERIVAEYDFLAMFDAGLFGKVAERIYVESSGDLTFRLRCGMELTVKTEDGI